MKWVESESFRIVYMDGVMREEKMGIERMEVLHYEDGRKVIQSSPLTSCGALGDYE